MNVASLELCKELYKLSGWKDTEAVYIDMSSIHYAVYKKDVEGTEKVKESLPPAYSLGYLLRKLPPAINMRKEANKYWFRHATATPRWIAADTPEDCAAKLAIELWKQRVLK